MVIGVGTDIIEISRIKNAMSKPGFMERCFSDRELRMLEGKKLLPQSVAAGFAAKEAVSKSFGTGISGFNLKDIEVLRDELGKPYINLCGAAKELAAQLGVKEVLVSLSHNQTSAIAFAVAQ